MPDKDQVLFEEVEASDGYKFGRITLNSPETLNSLTLSMINSISPQLDKWAQKGIPTFTFPEPKISGYDFSFSGLKTAILYFIRDSTAETPDFIERNLADLCASIQERIVSILLNKIKKASKDLNIKDIAIAGGVSANSRFRTMLNEFGDKYNWSTYTPKSEFCTDNAAMIGITAHYKYLRKEFSDLSITPSARLKI